MARIAGSENEMLETLKTVKGVKSVASLGQTEQGAFDFVIEPEDGEDIRAAVFDRVVSRGRKLLLLKDNKLSLEQVFLRLTGADSSEAEKLLNKDDETAEVEVEVSAETEDGEVSVKTESEEEN